VIVAASGKGVMQIMTATLLFAVLSIVCQAVAVRRVVSTVSFVPRLDRSVLEEILAFGCFSWLQSLAAAAFLYADRMLLAAFLGTSAVAYYTICTQVAQPIHGLAAAALNFVFPHISSRLEAGETSGPKRVFRICTLVNVAFVGSAAVVLAVLAKPILSLWMGKAFAEHAHVLLSLLVLAYALLGLNIISHLSLLALGQVRYVSLVTLSAGALSLIAAAGVIPMFGLLGGAYARILYAAVEMLKLVKAHARFSQMDHSAPFGLGGRILSADIDQC
jgi:O-antigen/teichoic acid export membrane protein